MQDVMTKKDPEIVVGKKFGALTIQRFELRGKNNVVITACDCGKERVFWKKSAVKRQKSCGCGIDKNNLTAQQRRSWNFRIQGYKQGAKKRGYVWDLTFEDFVVVASQPCSFCGEPPRDWECFSNAPSVRKDSPLAKTALYVIKISGIDRLDNTQGYTKENSVPCCIYCNRAKSDLSFSDFKNHVEKMHQWLSQNLKKEK
jgi:hypothetical protein